MTLLPNPCKQGEQRPAFERGGAMLVVAGFCVFSPTRPLLAFSVHTATQLAHTILLLDAVSHQQGLGTEEATCQGSTWLCLPLPIHFSL